MTAQPAPQQPYGGAVAEDPSKTMAIVGLVLDFLFAPVGLIVSYLARKKSLQAGFDGGLAKIGFIIGIITTVLWVIGVIVNIITFSTMMKQY